MELSEVKVGMQVMFGRKGAEKDLGEVVELVGTTIKVKALEPHGGSPAGTIWQVAPWAMVAPLWTRDGVTVWDCED